jgi:hypothetical protein
MQRAPSTSPQIRLPSGRSQRRRLSHVIIDMMPECMDRRHWRLGPRAGGSSDGEVDSIDCNKIRKSQSLSQDWRSFDRITVGPFPSVGHRVAKPQLKQRRRRLDNLHACGSCVPERDFPWTDHLKHSNANHTIHVETCGPCIYNQVQNRNFVPAVLVNLLNPGIATAPTVLGVRQRADAIAS